MVLLILNLRSFRGKIVTHFYARDRPEADTGSRPLYGFWIPLLEIWIELPAGSLALANSKSPGL